MEWSDKFLIGIATIDNQHKELFRKINDLVVAIREKRCKDEIDKTISFLEDYARVHFREEERQMISAGYPGYEEQVGEHRQYLSSIAELKLQASMPRVPGSSYDLSATTNQVVVDWIVQHILRVDMKFAEFLRLKQSLQGDGL